MSGSGVTSDSSSPGGRTKLREKPAFAPMRLIVPGTGIGRRHRELRASAGDVAGRLIDAHMRILGDHLTRLLRTLTGGPDRLPRFSPDGASILFARDDEGAPSLYVVGALGGTPRRY